MDNNVNGYQPITREDNCFSEGLPSKFNPFKPCQPASQQKKYQNAKQSLSNLGLLINNRCVSGDIHRKGSKSFLSG